MQLDGALAAPQPPQKQRVPVEVEGLDKFNFHRVWLGWLSLDWNARVEADWRPLKT